MEIEQQIRDALQHDAAELVTVGPGPEHARRRASRRKRRTQTGVVALSAVALAGGTLAVIETRPASPRTNISPAASQPPAAPLVWKSVDGVVEIQSPTVTGSDGVTYALSTAPGATGNSNAPTDLYATRDGVNWTHAALGSQRIEDLSETGGVLYAIGTGPGSQGGTDYQLSTSSDGGANWSPSSLPVQFNTPASSVPLIKAENVQVAHGARSTVVVASASYAVDTTQFTAGHDNYSPETTADGVRILDVSSCMNAKIAMANKAAAAPGVAATGRALEAGGCEGTVVATHSWSELGITDPAALRQQEALVSDDGSHWQPVSMTAAADTMLEDVAATQNGFVLVEQPTNGSGGVQLLSSADGHTWTPLAGVPAFDNVSISGDRIIGVNGQTSDVSVSTDGGVTWSPATNVEGLPGVTASTASKQSEPQVEAGPLGFAALVNSNGSNGASKAYLAYSTDGISWQVTDLAAKGAPADRNWGNLSVGADHIDVAYEVPADGPQGPNTATKLVTLVGTPQA